MPLVMLLPEGTSLVSDTAAVLERAADGGRITPEEALDLYRDAPLTCIGEGTNEMQRIIIARQWIKRSATV